MWTKHYLVHVLRFQVVVFVNFFFLSFLLLPSSSSSSSRYLFSVRPLQVVQLLLLNNLLHVSGTLCHCPLGEEDDANGRCDAHNGAPHSDADNGTTRERIAIRWRNRNADAGQSVSV
jgi:hypothetical protein